MVTVFAPFGAIRWVTDWVQVQAGDLQAQKNPPQRVFNAQGHRITWQQVPRPLGQQWGQQAFLLLAMPKPRARPTANRITATKTAQTTG
jgi:hypothetical protein